MPAFLLGTVWLLPFHPALSWEHWEGQVTASPLGGCSLSSTTIYLHLQPLCTPRDAAKDGVYPWLAKQQCPGHAECALAPC